MQGLGGASGLHGVAAPYPFRVHQQRALDAIDKAVADGAQRARVVLPPGAGKTLVGLETVRRRGCKTVVFSPNAAAQTQWLSTWDSFLQHGVPDRARLRGHASRGLHGFLTALTYQSLGTFRPDSEVYEDGGLRQAPVRISPNGQLLLEEVNRHPGLTVVLDECHHLLEVWDETLRDVLDQFPDVFLLSLSATPPENLTHQQQALADELFGPVTYAGSLPAAVREGEVVPFADLAWLTRPTAAESAWLRRHAERFEGRGRRTVDRVLARSESKTHAVLDIVAAERSNLSEKLRMLVVCDHEYASAVLPADLTTVMSPQGGSASYTLQRLVAAAPDLNPMLVTGSTVAGSPTTLQKFLHYVREYDPDLAANLGVARPNAEVTHLRGRWRRRQWVGWATRFFEEGHCQVLVGTRSLLGEGWDTYSVTGVIDLTAAASPSSVVQTRGRSLRTDPTWPAKVAVNWTVVCATEDHPKGGNDWHRFVRKHEGVFAVSAYGEVLSGVGHVDPSFSSSAPPPVARFDEVNRRTLRRAENRKAIRAAWRVGEEYDDRVVHTLLVRPDAPRGPVSTEPRRVVVRRPGLEVRDDFWAMPWRPAVLPAFVFVLAVVAFLLDIVPTVYIALAAMAGLAYQTAVAARRGRALVEEAAIPPSIEQVACAVADGLREAGLSAVGAEAVHVASDEGWLRCFLIDVPPEVSARFADALDEVLSPLRAPRYLLQRWYVDQPPGSSGYGVGLKAALGTLLPDGQEWYPVPSVFESSPEHARAFARAWDAWVGGSVPLDVESPEGIGVLATHRGSDPFAVTTVMRDQWR